MNEVMTADEVAGLLQVHVRTIYRLVRERRIPGMKIGGLWRFSRTLILENLYQEMRTDKGEPLLHEDELMKLEARKR